MIDKFNENLFAVVIPFLQEIKKPIPKPEWVDSFYTFVIIFSYRELYSLYEPLHNGNQ